MGVVENQWASERLRVMKKQSVNCLLTKLYLHAAWRALSDKNVYCNKIFYNSGPWRCIQPPKLRHRSPVHWNYSCILSFSKGLYRLIFSTLLFSKWLKLSQIHPIFSNQNIFSHSWNKLCIWLWSGLFVLTHEYAWPELSRCSTGRWPYAQFSSV